MVAKDKRRAMDNKFMIVTISFKTILIMPVIVVLLGGVVPHTQRAFAQVDRNASPDDPSCQSSSSPQPSTQTCPDGSVIDASATCSTPTSTSGNNNQPTLSCNPGDSNPPPGCRQASQSDSSGSCSSGTGITHYGSCCPHGTMNVRAFCDTQGSQNAKAQRALQFDIGAACTIGGLVGGPVGHFVKSAIGGLVCQ
ncbi:MAG: hypothetical protein WAZ77_08215 [Candidatus Nitrosopolaris sp.]